MHLDDLKMSDEDRDIDIESDDDDDGPHGAGRTELQFASQAEKRAHHNALERKRRDHIKDSFCSLRDSVPALHGEKASRAQILKKAADYIEYMRRKNCSHQQDIDDLKRQNHLLETQIRALEKAKYTGSFATMASNSNMNGKAENFMKYEGTKPEPFIKFEGSESENSEVEEPTRQKKMKT